MVVAGLRLELQRIFHGGTVLCMPFGGYEPQIHLTPVSQFNHDWGGRPWDKQSKALSEL